MTGEGVRVDVAEVTLGRQFMKSVSRREALSAYPLRCSRLSKHLGSGSVELIHYPTETALYQRHRATILVIRIWD